MFDLLKVIQNRLSETGYNIFFNEKDSKSNYPFVVFNLPISEEGTNSFREDFSLEVDIWTKDITENIKMTNHIRNLMHKFQTFDSSIQVSFYVINRLSNIKDEDDKIKRSQLRILAKTYFIN